MCDGNRMRIHFTYHYSVPNRNFAGKIPASP